MSYVTRGVELVPCSEATRPRGLWQRLVDVRDCSDLSLQDVDHLLLRHSPPRPPNPPVRPRPIRRVRRRASGRRSTVPRAFAMLYMRLCRPTPARSVATRELRPTVLPPASLYAGSFTLQLDTHRHRDRRHTSTRSPRREATRIGRRSQRDHTASCSK